MSTSTLYYLIFVGAFILMVWGFYIPFRAGLLYNGAVYCMAIGGYAAAFMVKELCWPFWLAMIAVIFIGGLMGFIPALGFSRTTGIVTAVASMALIFITQSVIRNIEFLGGSRGILGIPKVPYLLWVTIGLVVVIGVLIHRLDHSRIGRALEAVATDRTFAQTMGINERWLIVFALTLSSILGALSGAIYAFNTRVIQPETYGFSLLLSSSTMLFLGGRYTQWGALVSVPVLWGIPQWIPPQLASFTQIIYGALLIIVLILRPEGIITRKMITNGSMLVKGIFSGKKSKIGA